MSRDVPEGWRAVKIGNILSIRRGVTWDKEAELPQGTDDAMPVISIPNIQDRLDLKHLRYIKRKSVPDMAKFVASAGWTLMVGSNGNPARVGNCVLAAGVDQCLFASFLLGIYPIDTSRLLPEYAYRILSNQVVQDAISASVQGTTGLRNISVRMLRELEVFLPPPYEQQRIAEILSSVDEAIAATRAVIEQTRKVQQGVLERLLTKGIGHTRFKQTEIGEIPEGWTSQKVADVGSVRGGKRMPAGRPFAVYRTAHPYIRVSDFSEGSIDRRNLVYVLPEDQTRIAKYTISHRDVYISIAGTIGAAGMIPFDLDGAQLTENAAKISVYDEARLMPEYLSLLFSSHIVQKQIEAAKGLGGGVPKLALFRIEDIKLPVPSREEQGSIVQYVSATTEALRSAKLELNALSTAKSALMSDLLTGRKRVTDALPLAAE